MPLKWRRRISFEVSDIHAEYERLKAAGVHFTQPPVAMGPVTTACWTIPAEI
jgi:hypothetical protein